MNKRKKKIFLFLFLGIFIGVIGTFFINYFIISSTKHQIIEISKLNNKDVDAILVLGCKVYDDSPSLMLTKRLEKGIEVYNTTHAKLLLSGDHGRKDYDEVDIMSDYIKDSGIDENDIFLDHAGFSTYDSIYRAKYIFGVKKMIIVTQKYHMYRAIYIANKLGIESIGVVADNIPQKSIMLKQEIREILSRDKNFFKVLLKPASKYLGEKISLS